MFARRLASHPRNTKNSSAWRSLVVLAALLVYARADLPVAPWQDVASYDAVFPGGNFPSGGPLVPQTLESAAQRLPTLLYWTIAGSLQYEEMLRLQLITLRPILRAWAGSLHLVVIAAPPNAQRVIQIVEEAVPHEVRNATVHTLEAASTFEAAAHKLAIGQLSGLALLETAAPAGSSGQLAGDASLPRRPRYERVVYMDVDMLVLPPLPRAAARAAGGVNATAHRPVTPHPAPGADWPLARLLRMPLEADLLYAPGEITYDVDNEYFSLGRYTPKQLAAFRGEVPPQEQAASAIATSSRPRGVLRPRRPFNTGFFMFRPSERLLGALATTYADALGTPEGARPRYCMEQPYMNHHLHTSDLVDWEALVPHIITDSKLTPRDGDPLAPEAAVVHITGLTARPERINHRKLARTRAVFLRLLAQVPREQLLN